MKKWLENVEHALKEEAPPDSFSWQQDQFFELVKPLRVEANGEAIMCVRAVLNGKIATEVEPTNYTVVAKGISESILNNYSIPHTTETPVETQASRTSLALMGIAIGVLAAYGLFKIMGSSDKSHTPKEQA